MDENSTVKERLKAFVRYLNISEREFCKTIGVGSAYIASIKKSVKADKLEAISRQYPELNPIWLIRGEGSMLLKQTPTEVPTAKVDGLAPSEMLYKLLEDANGEKARLLNLVESQQRTIEMLTAELKKANAQRGADAGCAAVG